MRSNSPLKIALYDPSGLGGVCHYTYQLAQNLALMGSDVTVVTTENYELKHLPRNFNITFLFKKSWIKRLGLNLIAPVRWQGSYDQEPALQNGAQADEKSSTLALLKNLRLRIIWLKAAFFFLWKRPDLIHFQWLVDRNQEYFFLNLLKLLRFKIVYTVHDLLPQESEACPDHHALEKIYRKADALIVHAESNKREFVSAFNVDPEKIYVIPHGSNDLFYTDKGMSKEAAKEELGVSQKRVILFFGLIKRYKGLEYLVEAFREVKERLDNVVLIIVGKIYDKDREGFNFYSDLIGQLRSHENVVCVEDYVPLEKIGLYFSASDVVVLPYIRNYTSGVLLSAYAAGRPVVVTDTGGLKESVEDGKSGFVVPPKDTRALAQAIIETVASPDRCNQMGKYAKSLAESNYSWSSVASKTIALYRHLTLNSAITGRATQVIVK
jgi:glycosyltransferase involved in cell wall biosynthesis